MPAFLCTADDFDVTFKAIFIRFTGKGQVLFALTVATLEVMPRLRQSRLLRCCKLFAMATEANWCERVTFASRVSIDIDFVLVLDLVPVVVMLFFYIFIVFKAIRNEGDNVNTVF